MPAIKATRVCPYLVVKDCNDALAFYREAFGAVETYRLNDPVDGRIGHAEITIGETCLMLADEYPDFGALSPDSIGGSPVKMHLEVDDAEAFLERAVAAGATVLRPLRDEFFGHRTGLVADPFGYSWFIASKIEDVSAEEAQKRWNETVSR